ncbi:hypothetical protein EW145_g5092 [Phellinidium pouzarii]|uniref:Protein kinase domain-containing protein n=1 Tax=Phellinidium pouzarii TaxID=167371 RepID=A0A4S4L1D9_9AGAM|nr:hypothetical protein EW145_g5092 [Phellinidium pouzarii]
MRFFKRSHQPRPALSTAVLNSNALAFSSIGSPPSQLVKSPTQERIPSRTSSVTSDDKYSSDRTSSVFSRDTFDSATTIASECKVAADSTPNVTITDLSATGDTTNALAAVTPTAGANLTPKSRSSASILSNLPLDGITNIVMEGAYFAAAAAPLPWVGPAVQLVGSIIDMCKNIAKNRGAAIVLADHCKALLQSVQEKYSTPSQESLENVRSELESLLEGIKNEVKEWAELNWLKSFIQQETISGKISSFHLEIEFFCKRYTIAVQKEITAWQQAHEAQSKADHENLMKYLASIANTQELENRCRREEISALREDFVAFYDFVQTLLLGLRREPDQVQQTEQCKALEANLSAIYRSSGMLPPNIELTEGLIQMQDYSEFGHGMFSIFRGTCFNDVNCLCAFKVRFERQLKHWKSIQTEVTQARERKEKIYILPLIGAICRDNGPGPFLCFISPWMEKGNALDFVRTHEDTDRIDLIRKIALGLKVLHMHNPPLAHGYIRASNVLIDDMCDPLLSDFGLMRIVEDARAEPMASTSMPDSRGAFRLLPPEILGLLHGPEEDQGHSLSTKSDIFMYAMTVLEVSVFLALSYMMPM